MIKELLVLNFEKECQTNKQQTPEGWNLINTTILYIYIYIYIHLLRPTGDESIRRDGLSGPFQLEVYEVMSHLWLSHRGNEIQESRKGRKSIYS